MTPLLVDVRRWLEQEGFRLLDEPSPPVQVHVKRAQTIVLAHLQFADHQRSVAVKQMGRSSSLGSLESLWDLHRRVRQAVPCLAEQTPEFYGFEPRRNWMLMQFVPGPTLEGRMLAVLRPLKASGGDGDEALRALAKAMAALHRLKAADFSMESQPRTLASFVPSLESSAEQRALAAHLRKGELSVDSLLKRLSGSILERVGDRLVFTDSQPKNVLLPRVDAPCIIDIEYSVGHAAMGVARFLVGLDRLLLRPLSLASEKKVGHWQRSFLETYLSVATPSFAEELDFCYPWVLLNVANSHVSRRPRWTDYLARFYVGRLDAFLKWPNVSTNVGRNDTPRLPAGFGSKSRQTNRPRSTTLRPGGVQVERLSKEYAIGRTPSGDYRTLRESLATAPQRSLNVARAIYRGRQPQSRSQVSASKTFLALHDVSFDVRPGEVLGIIGSNGAGKSTLLKVLSRITEPTAGRVSYRGRVASLLEVGTGFHPELTGRENVFMNGSILGMSRREIARKFDEIVAFAEIDQFLDTPVKRYSSGMYVRLAFAVAAHLDAEILVVDEVLAVGDISFQRKCMQRMRASSETGRTILFVSHNLAALESLCSRALLLDHGRLSNIGSTENVLGEYRKKVFDRVQPRGEKSPSPSGIVCEAFLLDRYDRPTSVIPLGGEFNLRIDIKCTNRLACPKLGIGIDDVSCRRVLTLHSPASRDELGDITDAATISCRVKEFPLAPGQYTVKIAVTSRGEELFADDRAFVFNVADGNAFGEGRGFHRGLCVAPSTWSVGRVD